MSSFATINGVNRRAKWIPGRVTYSVGTRMFIVQCADGVHRRHVDQMRHVQGQSLAHVFAAIGRPVPVFR